GLSAFDALLTQAGMGRSLTPRHALLRLLINRAVLRLRGLRFRQREVHQIPPRELQRMDIARSVALGISIVDVIEGANWQAQALLRALRGGEPLRIAQGFAWEAVHSASRGRPAHRRTERLLRDARRVAEMTGHPHALGMVALASGCTEFLEGRFETA